MFDLLSSAGLALALATSNPGPAVAPTVSEALGDQMRVSETRINTYTQSNQEDPALAIDANGRVLVTWSSKRQELGTYGVFGQLLDPLGRPLGTELHINQTLPGGQKESAAVFAPDGTAWVVWNSIRPETSKNGIFARRLADGPDGFGPIGDELRLGDSSFHYYSTPTLTVGADGTLLVGWIKQLAHTQAFEVVRLDPEGKRLGDVLTLDQPVRVDQKSGQEIWGSVNIPCIVARTDGGYFAAWSRVDDLGRPEGIMGRAIDCEEDSMQLGPEIALVSKGKTYPVEPSLGVDAAGNMVLAWMANPSSGGDYSVFARRLSAQGAPLGDTLAIDSDRSGAKSGATAIVAPDGRFAVAYNLYSGKVDRQGNKPLDQVDVRAALFDASGAPQGESWQVNQEGAGSHALQIGRNDQQVAWNRAGQLALAWSGDIAGDGSGVALSLFTPLSLQPEAPAVFEAVAALGELTQEDMLDGVKPDLIPPHLRNLRKIQATFGQAGSTGFQAHDQTQFTPPDPALAVGPDRIVTQANGEIAIFDKAGGVLLRQGTNSASGFWGALGGSSFIFDPVNTYDIHSNRFFVMNSELATGDFMAFAVSTNSSPTTTNDWFKYRVQVSPVCNFPDFPNIGNNDTAYFITTDCFSGGGNRAYIFDKSIVDNGGALPSLPSVQMSTGLQSLGNTEKYDTGSTQFFISAGFSGTSPNLTMQAITNPTTSPSVTTFILNTGKNWTTPPNAPQLGSASQLDTIDNRIKHGVVRNDKLYCTHNVGVAGITRVRWYEIDLNGWPSSGNNPSVNQSGDIDLGPNVYTWFGDAHPDASGNLAISYNRSASTERASIEYVTRLVTDPPGTVSAPSTLQVSTTADTSGRWGDYGYIDEDPSAPGTFWGTHEYSQGPWATWAGTFSIPGGGADPLAQFSGTPLSGVAPLNVAFTDLSTGTALSAWSWDFGDGTTSTLQNPSHNYVNPGTYTVSLDVTGSAGTDNETKVGYVVVNTVGGGITKYGTGLGGANIGTLCSNSTPVAGGQVTLDVSGIPNGTTGLLWVSLTQTNLSMFGGTLLADLATAPVRIPYTLVGGQASIVFTIPAGAAGVTAFSQAGARDTSQTQGIALTNGLQIDIQ